MKIKTKHLAGPLDKHIGSRMRVRRCLLGISQQELSQHLSVSFQQIQKYEKGQNRISASRLFDISKVLDVDITYFYLNDDNQLYEKDNVTYLNDSTLQLPEDVFTKKETHRLLQGFYRIHDKECRKSILSFIEKMTERS